LRFDNELATLVVRATLAKGIILSSTLPDLPEGYYILTPADFPTETVSLGGTKTPILARGQVRYEGEPLYLLAGRDPDILRMLAREIRIEYEADLDGEGHRVPSDEHRFRRGDPADTEPQRVVDSRFEIESSTPLRPEGPSAIAVPDGGAVTVYTPAPWIHGVRDLVRRTLGLPAASVRVLGVANRVSRHDFLHYPVLQAIWAAALALKTNRPVRVSMESLSDREWLPRPPLTEIHLFTACDDAGTPVARTTNVELTGGADGWDLDALSKGIAATIAGVYVCPVNESHVVSYSSEAPPVQAPPGGGLAPAFFALETHVSEIAGEYGQDPADWRIRHLAAPSGARSARGPKTAEHPGAGLLRTVVEMSDFGRRFSSYRVKQIRRGANIGVLARRRGIGVSLAYGANGLACAFPQAARAEVQIELLEGEKVWLRSSCACDDPVLQSTWRQVITRTLAVRPEDVSFAALDSNLVPDSGPALSDRAYTFVTPLIQKACAAIQKQRFREPLPIRVKKSVRVPSADSQGTIPSAAVTWGSLALELEYDAATLEATVRSIWAAIGAGSEDDDRTVKRRVESGIHQALMWSLGGETLSGATHLSVYRVPYRTIPDVRIDVVRSARAGFRGVDELPFNLVPAAFASALAQASDIPRDSLPFIPRAPFLETERR
jgi:CO/xanthine dehydrogenase Mo-binding subunit